MPAKLGGGVILAASAPRSALAAAASLNAFEALRKCQGHLEASAAPRAGSPAAYRPAMPSIAAFSSSALIT